MSTAQPLALSLDGPCQRSGCVPGLGINVKSARLLLGFLVAVNTAAPAADFLVEMLGEPYRFEPANLTVNVGDTVTWVNHDPVSLHATISDVGGWESELLFEDETFTHLFTTTGIFPYYGWYLGMTGQVTVLAASNAPPSVAITSPTNGATFAAPAAFTIAAIASDADGTITNVQFFVGVNLVGIRTNASSSVTASNLPASPYDLTATATDNLGLTSTSAPVRVTVVTPAELRLNRPEVTPQQVRVSFTTTSNLTYVLEATTDLRTGWTALSTNVASGPLITVTHPAPSPPRRFFRAYLLR